MSTRTGVPFADDLVRSLGAGAAPPPDLIARAEAAFGNDGFTALLAPDSADAVAAVLASCTREQWPVVPLGAATWITYAGPAVAGAESKPPILLSTARLNRITEHEPADLVIGVQAGVPQTRIAEALQAERQWLPLDPPAGPQATIGAVIAGAAAGPLRAGHGTPRDMVLGLEIATGDGRLLRFGGRVVKNVAGYDGVRLAVGSRGKLGVITAAYLRVRGAPRADRTLAIGCGRGADGARRGADMALAVRAAAACDALELLSPAVAGAISREPPRAGWTLLVRMLGSEAAVADGIERVKRALAGPTPGVGAGSQDAEGGGDRVAMVSSGIWGSVGRVEANAALAVRLTCPTTALPDALAGSHAALASAEDSSAEGAPDWLVAAHAADGVIRLWQPVRQRTDGSGRQTEHAAEAAGNGLRNLGELSEKHGWTLRFDRVEHAGIAAEGGRGAAAAVLEARLRKVFDRAGILRSGGQPW